MIVKRIAITVCSGAEHNTSRRAPRLGSRNTLPGREVPDAMAFSYLRGLLALRGRVSMVASLV
ncbi:hypothetical protein K0M31_001144 [Melipona bicolor]|uniref:Uncharacterized protein n=1 Tax=Melipona bicolor TaxID=60889 RepID=A0AA40GEY9_9HYME|nr:hypothetical protein K0M31_001144 [Melipona bicolor]